VGRNNRFILQITFPRFGSLMRTSPEVLCMLCSLEPKTLYIAVGGIAGRLAPQPRALPNEDLYSDSRKFCRNQITLLDKPAVAPTSESVNSFENSYSSCQKFYPIRGDELPTFVRKQESSNLFWVPACAGTTGAQGKRSGGDVGNPSDTILDNWHATIWRFFA